MNNKIVSKKTNSAVFLAIVLVTGTITALSSQSSFMIIGSAQAQPYYDGGMDNRYNYYEPDYGMDNNDRKSYDMRSYGNDYGYDKSQYQPSYKPDYYKPAYPSYGKDDSRDKSKDSSKSVSINKIKCTTNNIVVNGNNTGDVNIGNNGQVPTAEEGHLGAYSSGGGGYGERYYNDGYDNKKNKGFTCIIDNNNIINNIVAGAGGNVTDGNGNVTDTCEGCFSSLLNTQIEEFLQEAPTPIPEDSLSEFCNSLRDLDTAEEQAIAYDIVETGLETTTGVTDDQITAILECLERQGLIIEPV